MRAVFLDYATFSSGLDITAIEKTTSELICYDFTSPEQIITRCINADIIITNKVILDEAILKQLPQLKLICVAATGINNIDISAATANRISVTNVSNYAGPAVAQYIFSQLLSLLQDVEHHNQNVQQGLWSVSKSFCVHGNAINELYGRSIGILGYGHIGQTVATIAQAFGMNVIIAEHPNAKLIREGRVCFENMLKQSDIVSLHCPLTPTTKHIINQKSIASMRENSILINTARGGLINSNDLLNALKSKQIGYAILDVLEQEPPTTDHPLLAKSLGNLRITAHIAWASQQAQQRLLNIIAENITQFSLGTSINQVN
ncbi:D-2-hydroxyacid dehydrogenase [Thalassotalea sp. M1531]|uniref:D-2-hydroxyacid dehydrogenase n=1 Tax=Thalassotalea algicola TaxID=2716224 RepID=A0A7Y0LDF4_9GAMM|nr:D-2-hydroxyacid dehydrogenase [Thalassotalea algicola]NMP32153.1 D-2-hydroxyacid dehydrogenase [Thalassotalea algicola]